MDEVERPALVRQGYHRSWCSGPDSPFAASSSADNQTFLDIEPLRLLAIDHQALAAQQDVQAPVTKPPPLVRQLPQPAAKLGIITTPGPIAHARAVGIDHTARPPFAHLVKGSEMGDSFPLRGRRHH